MATIANMGAETGATTSIFPYSEAMSAYLRATNRPEIAEAARLASQELAADPGAEYDRVIEIDLSSLEPHINGPFTPDLTTPVSKLSDTVEKEGWPSTLTAGLIGSCTNSSFQDMTRAADLARQALDAGLKPKMPLLVSPGSEQTRKTLEDAGSLQIFEELNGTLLTNACGPCCGSWDRQGMEKVQCFVHPHQREYVLTLVQGNGKLDYHELQPQFYRSSGWKSRHPYLPGIARDGHGKDLL